MLDNLSLPNLSEKIQQLASRVNSGYWFEKEYLPVPDAVQQFIDNPQSAWQNSSQVQAIASRVKDATLQGTFTQQTLPPIIDIASANPDLIKYSSLQLLQACHSANRAFNSKLYPTTGEIQNKIQDLVSKLLFGGSEELLYNKTIQGFNGVLKVPLVANELGISGFNSQLVPAVDPNISLLIGDLGNLAKFIFSLSGIAAGFEQIAALTAGSIVVRGLSSTGRALAKYQIVNILKSGTILLPPATEGVIANSAWLGLMQVAPWIIIAGVIITIVLSESEKKIAFGSDLFIFQKSSGEKRRLRLRYPKLEENQQQLALQQGFINFSTYYGNRENITAVILDQGEAVAVYNLNEKVNDQFLKIAEGQDAQILFKKLLEDYSSNIIFESQEEAEKKWGPFEEED